MLSFKSLGSFEMCGEHAYNTQPVNMQMHAHLLLLQPGFDCYRSYAAGGARGLGKVGGAKR